MGHRLKCLLVSLGRVSSRLIYKTLSPLTMQRNCYVIWFFPLISIGTYVGFKFQPYRRQQYPERTFEYIFKNCQVDRELQM